ncbi:hypothetical protein [Pseudorhodoplanes sp.]|uniref:hypothetical protein n=1 Tax=Pseudorhodoplanes sp. TaxID=1934341 RepID=UPI002BE2767A|nr:hypothetical protein [Pseudorhodoplanes sp.]HWV53177.1 hypothetical protein [Pseudorhodoplanes sp.]
MKFALALAAALIATPVAAQSPVKPTALLFNGLAQYQPGILTPLAPLASDLRQQGWRVVIDNHLGIFSRSEEPVLIIGHSAGGARAYMFGKKMVEEAKFHPTIITLDAATIWGDVYRCPVENCINIHTLTYPRIPGSYNLSAGKITDSIVTHVSIPLNGDIRKAILQQAADLLRGGSNLSTLVSAYSPEPPRAGRSLAEVWRRNVGQPREMN